MPSKSPCADLFSFHLPCLSCVRADFRRVISDLYSCNFKLLKDNL